MNTIIIKDLEVFYHVGVPDEERAQPQRLLISVEMEHDFSDAAQTDDLKKTIDYFAVAQRLLKFGEGRNWKLIEKLASEIATLVIQEFHANTATVEVKKFIIPEAQFVAVRFKNARE
ncbi:MAG: dihydroneopterin aldolase [Verrucomicrobiota bacterium]